MLSGPTPNNRHRAQADALMVSSKLLRSELEIERVLAPGPLSDLSR
jgi:hypothetical protein